MKFISGGDYNAKHPQWSSRLSNPKGKELHKTMILRGYNHISTGEPTYWPTNPREIPDLLDFFITKGISLSQIEVNSSFDLSFDQLLTVENEKRLYWANSKTDWFLYKALINDDIDLKILLKAANIDQAVELLTKMLQGAAYHWTPEAKTENKQAMNHPLFVRIKLAEKSKEEMATV